MTTPARSKQLNGLQRLWFVVTMIWIVLAAALKVPEMPVGASAYRWAREEIGNQLRMFERQAAGTSVMASRSMDESARQADAEYVAVIMADKGATIATRICAGRPGCPPSGNWLSPALAGIEMELDRRLKVIETEQRAVIMQVVALCLLPPLAVYLLGWLIGRLLGAGRKAGD